MVTGEVIAALADSASEEFAAAKSLPPQAYHDEGLYTLEIERIFEKEWICIGRLAEIPNPGDYICRNIIDAPVFIVRQQNGGVKAFANICAHRAAQLLSGDGHVARISCPYHSWTYALDGKLVGAPFMQDSPQFNVSGHQLAEYSCDTWEGFVYVSRDPNSAPISKRLKNLTGLIGNYRIADYVPVFSRTDVWHTNWKCLVENFMDAYHIHRVHKDSFALHGSSESSTSLCDGEDSYSYHYIEEGEGAKAIKVPQQNVWLTGQNRNRTYLINVFPAHTMQLQPDMLWYLSVLPLGTERLEVRWAVSVPEEVLDQAQDRGTHIDELVAFLHQVNSEDKPIVESICKTTRSSAASRGPLSTLEHNVWQFGRYLKRQLAE